MRLDDLDRTSSLDEIAAAIDEIAGWPASSHDFFLAQLKDKTGRDLPSLRARLKRALTKRQVTKYSRLRLKSCLLSHGTKGKVVGKDFIVSDPLTEGDEIIVRDAALLGHFPIVDKKIGYSHPIDDYVVALIGGIDIKPFEISSKEIKELAVILMNCDSVKEIPPALLSLPNVAAFSSVLKDSQFERLLITLKMNTRFSIVENGGQLTIFENATRVAYTRGECEAKLAPEIDLVVSKRGPIPVSRYKTWFWHSARAHYKSITFAPAHKDTHGREKDLSTSFNLWTGFVQAPAPGDWSLLKQHILEILCRGDVSCYEYVLNWLAHLFQRPWEKPGVAIVCWGEKRTGKGTVADAIREALGPELSRMFTQNEHVVGRFAGSAQPLMFNHIEEAVFARNPKEEGPLKSKITDPTETVELKFKTPYEVPSFGRWWFNSNHEAPVPITFDEERYFILHVSNERANDHAYFAAIREQMYHKGGLAGMVDELMTRDISKFNVRKPPATEHRAKMVLEMLPARDRAIADILIEGEIARLDHKDPGLTERTTLNRHAPTWVDKDIVRVVLNGAFRRYGSQEASASDITKALNESGIIDGSRNAHKERDQKAGYRFRPLIEARKTFAEKRRLEESFFTGSDGVRSSLEEIRDIVAAASGWSDKNETSFGEPQNFKAIRRAILELERCVGPASAANDNAAAAERAKINE